MPGARHLLAVWLAASLLAGPRARAEIYRWVDKQGTVHFTDNPDQLPEPMRSKVLREIEIKAKEKQKKEKEKEKGRPPGSTRRNRPDGLPRERLPPAPGPKQEKPAIAPDTGRARRAKMLHWQTRACAARKKVADLEAECRRIRSERDASNRNALIYARPHDRMKATGSAKESESCEQRLARARTYRDVTLPEKARRQGASPGWLRGELPCEQLLRRATTSRGQERASGEEGR